MPEAATAAEVNAAYTAASSVNPTDIILTSPNLYNLGTRTWAKPASLIGQTYTQDQALLNNTMPYTVRAVFRNIAPGVSGARFAGFAWDGQTTGTSNGPGSMIITGSNFTIEDVIMYNNIGAQGTILITVGDFVSGNSLQAANVVIRRARFKNVGDVASGDPFHDHPIYAKNCEGLTIEDSLFHDNYGYFLHLYKNCKNGRFRRLLAYNCEIGVTFSGDVGNASTGSTDCTFSNGNILEDSHVLRTFEPSRYMVEKYYPCGSGISNQVNNTNLAPMGGAGQRLQSGLSPQVTVNANCTNETVTFVDPSFATSKDFRISPSSTGSTTTKGPTALRPTATSAPSNPQNFVGSAGPAGSGQITLTWGAPTTGVVTGYEIRRKTGSFPTSQTDGSSAYSGTALTVTDSGLTPGTPYYYRAYAKNGSAFSTGVNAPSAITPPVANVPPANPTNFVAVAGNAVVNLTWTLPAAGTYDTVQVRRKTGSAVTGPTDGTQVYSGTGSSYNDTAVVNGTQYYYAIYAVKGSLNSSGQASSPNPVQPTAPVGTTVPNVSGLSVTTVSASQINIAYTQPTPGTFDRVIIRRKLGSAPTSITDGDLVYQGRDFTDVVEDVITGLDTVWSLDWAPDTGHMFFTERAGRLKVWDGSTVTTILTIPAEVVNAEEGLQGMCLDPNWASEKYIYIYYSYGTSSNIQNRVSRYLYNPGTKTVGSETILINGIPGFQYHVGGRLRFGPDGMLYVLTGDAANNSDSGAVRAQDTTNLAGKILRINKDGTIPADNPISGNRMWTRGHRNPQGIAWNVNGDCYATEHGPTGTSPDANDEANRIVKGGNYGWPKYYGNNTNPNSWASSLTVTDPIFPIMSSNLQVWAPGDTEFYKGNMLDDSWNGKLLFSGLGIEGRVSDGVTDGRCIYRIPLTGTDLRTVGTLERVFLNLYGRIRALRQGPDGYLYFGTSNLDGRGTGTSDRVKRIRPGTGSALNVTKNDTGLAGGTQYYYTVFTVLGTDSSTGVSGNATTTGAAAPNPATNFVATPGNAQVVLTWTAPSGTYDSVTIRRKTGSAVTGPTDGTQIYNGSGTSFTDTGLVNGTPVYYAIYSTRSGVNSALVAPSVNPVTPVAPGSTNGVTDLLDTFNSITAGQPPDSNIWETRTAGAATTATALVQGTTPNKYLELTHLPTTQGYFSVQRRTPLLIDSPNRRAIGVMMYEAAAPDAAAGTWESTRFIIHKTFGLNATGDDTHYIRIKQRGTTATVERKLPTTTTVPEVMATLTGLPVGTPWELWFEIGPVDIALWANGTPVNLLGAGAGKRVPHGFDFSQVYLSFEVGTNRQDAQVGRLYWLEGMRNIPSTPTGVTAAVDNGTIDFDMASPPPEDHVIKYYYDLLEEAGNTTESATKAVTRNSLPPAGTYTVQAQTENNSKLVGS